MPKTNKCRDELFWEKVKQGGPDECWPWTGGLNSNGYGSFDIGKQRVGSHIYAFVYRHQRPITEGMFVCHHCDNPLCCNPNHLFEGTRQDNINDMMIKGRHKPSKGSKNGNAKLNEDDILRIRNLTGTISQHKIAAMFNVSHTCISEIQLGKKWRHI